MPPIVESTISASVYHIAGFNVLFLIATPIGNLKDITGRALETLASCHYLLCEDTRQTRILLNHYQINTPLKSFHRLNERAREESVLADLHAGQHIGLVSDAGTPLISDPGERLVKRCHQETIPVSPIPGPSALITALSASGLATGRFQFIGFLPKKKGALRRLLEESLSYPGTTIFYESPFRLVASLKLLAELSATQPCVVARELTKKFESIMSGSAEALCHCFSEKPPKGEIVLLIAGTV